MKLVYAVPVCLALGLCGCKSNASKSEGDAKPAANAPTCKCDDPACKCPGKDGSGKCTCGS